MSEEQKPADNQELPAAATGTPATDEGQGSESGKFDAAYVQQLRAEAAKHRTERNAFEKRLKEFEAKESERKKSEMSELERLKVELAEAKQSAEAAQRISQERLVRGAIIAEAAKAGFVDPDDAWRLVNASDTSITVDENGQVAGTDKAIKILIKTKPYLVKTAAAAANVNAADGRGNGQASAEQQQAKLAELRQRFRI